MKRYDLEQCYPNGDECYADLVESDNGECYMVSDVKGHIANHLKILLGVWVNFGGDDLWGERYGALEQVEFMLNACGIIDEAGKPIEGALDE